MTFEPFTPPAEPRRPPTSNVMRRMGREFGCDCGWTGHLAAYDVCSALGPFYLVLCAVAMIVWADGPLPLWVAVGMLGYCVVGLAMVRPYVIRRLRCPTCGGSLER